MLKIAVTGMGGGVGQSILKALRMSDLDLHITCIDISMNSAGLYWGNDYKILSNLKDQKTLPDDWFDFIEEAGINVVIPGSDYDLIPFAGLKYWFKDQGVHVLVSDLDLINSCVDKAWTTKLLRKHELPFPLFQGLGYPFVAKPVRGSGSVGMRIVRTQDDFKRALDELGNDYFQQEYLDGPEYTCSVFCDRDGQVIQTFMLERELRYGTTYSAKVGYWEDIDMLLREIGSKLKPYGPLNVQLRRTAHGLVPFELNCRCSGTTAIRAYYGYNEPEMMIRHFVLGEDVKPEPKRAGQVYRYWNEYFEGERRLSVWA